MFYDLPLRKDESLKLNPKATNRRNILVCPIRMQQQIIK